MKKLKKLFIFFKQEVYVTDKSTHEVRLARWKQIVEQCRARPKGQSEKPELNFSRLPDSYLSDPRIKERMGVEQAWRDPLHGPGVPRFPYQDKGQGHGPAHGYAAFPSALSAIEGRRGTYALIAKDETVSRSCSCAGPPSEKS